MKTRKSSFWEIFIPQKQERIRIKVVCMILQDCHRRLIASGGGTGVKEDEYIRKLTPKECFRLQGFDDEDYQVLKDAGISNTQIYKMAGNSITVNVIEFLFCQMFDDNNEIWL